jgi:DNA repair ATPase RecN
MEVAATSTETPNIAPVSAEAAPEAPPVEAAAPVVEAPKEEDNFAKRFAALSRKEKEIRAAQEEAKALKDKYTDYETAKKLAKVNPHEFLEKFGVTYEELTEYYINGRPKVDPKVQEIEERLATFQKQAEEKEKKLQEEVRQSAIAKFRTEQESFVKSAGEKFELVNAAKAYDLVYQVTQEYFDANKDKVENIADAMLSHEKAAEMVENHLEQELEKFSSTGKLKNKFGVKQDPKTETLAKIEQAKESKTLTNSMTGSANPNTSRPLTREESIERAARLIKWQ